MLGCAQPVHRASSRALLSPASLQVIAGAAASAAFQVSCVLTGRRIAFTLLLVVLQQRRVASPSRALTSCRLGLSMRLYSYVPVFENIEDLPDFGALEGSLVFAKDGVGMQFPFPDGGDCLTHPNGTVFRTNVAALASSPRGLPMRVAWLPPAAAWGSWGA